MGIDYSFFPVVGFVVTEATLIPLLKILPEASHMERRFNPKTGKEEEPVKVVDTPVQSMYVLDGSGLINDDEPMDFSEVCELIGQKIDCDVKVCGSALCGDLFCVFGPKLEPVDDDLCLQEGRIEASQPLLFHDVVRPSTVSEVAYIGEELVKLGLGPKDPIVGVGWYIS